MNDSPCCGEGVEKKHSKQKGGVEEGDYRIGIGRII
jgi:hypothetical protein